MPTSEPSLQAEGLRPPAPAGRAEEEEEVEEEERRKADAYRRRLSLVRVKESPDVAPGLICRKSALEDAALLTCKATPPECARVRSGRRKS